MQPINTQELCQFFDERGIDYSVVGGHRQFWEPAQLEKAADRHLVWSRALNQQVTSCPAPVMILPRKALDDHSALKEKTLFFVEDPRDAFRRIVLEMFSGRCDFTKGINDSKLFEKKNGGIWVGRNSAVAEDAVLGNNAIIHPNVTIYPNVVLGDNVEILPGSVIGAPGFGHVRQPDGRLEPFPHIGGVRIGSNVMVGSNTCIDCGGLSPTLIGDGVRIGNLTQIAHNVEIERDCLVGTRCQVAGGTKIGEGTEIWAGVTISNNRRIGRHCNIKIGSIVITHLPDGAVVSGNFAIPHDRNLEKFAELRSPL